MNDDKDVEMTGRCVEEDHRTESDSAPFVSILINNHNYAPFLGEAIESALTQTYQNIEVIVVDDGSTDASQEVIAGYGNRIVSVIKEKGGQASAFNAGFAVSKGDILCFLDSDDVFLSGKVDCVVKVFSEHSQVGWCFDRVQEFDSETKNYYPSAGSWKDGRWDVRKATANGRVPDLPTATSGLCFRRSTLALILPMPEILRITSDGYLKLAGLGLAEGFMLPGKLTLQRIHSNNAYTRRKDGRAFITALTSVLIGVCLYEKMPTLRRLAIVMLSRGLGMCWISGSPDPTYRLIASSFLRKLDPITRAEVILRATLCSASLFLSRS